MGTLLRLMEKLHVLEAPVKNLLVQTGNNDFVKSIKFKPKIVILKQELKN
jgi:hypothetical protein